MDDVNYTPNVVIENPKIRKGVNIFLSTAGVIVSLATIIDLNITIVDWSAYTTPSAGILVGISALFGIFVTVPNVPRK